MRTGNLVVGLLVAVVMQFQSDSGSARDRKLSSEVRVEQAHGRMPAGAKTLDEGKPPKGTPEGGDNAGAAAKAGPTAPVTCNQQNASSPACYSATQQARPVTR